MKGPSFTIIIPTYNRGDRIEKTVNSVLQQSYSDFELIVVDDGSIDQTRTKLSAIRDRRLNYFYIKNQERGAARNFGMDKARGNYVTFLDSDDLLYDDHLQEAFNYIQAQHPIMFFQQYEFVDSRGNHKMPYTPKQIPINSELVRKGNFMSCQGVFLAREISKTHRFNPDRALSGSEDYEFWLRLAAKYPIYYSPKVTSALVTHEDRSVLEIHPEKLITRKEKMLFYLIGNEEFMTIYKSQWQTIKSEAYSYLALHLALAKFNKLALRFMIKAFLRNPRYLTKGRFWSTLSRLLLD